MTLLYTKTTALARRNVFLVNFSYEHGDADKRTDYRKTVSLSKEEFANYLDKVNEVSRQIDDARASGQSLPRDFEDTAEYNKVGVPLELDCFASMHMSGYYAALSVQSIAYFDEQGDEYKVTNTK